MSSDCILVLDNSDKDYDSINLICVTCVNEFVQDCIRYDPYNLQFEKDFRRMNISLNNSRYDTPLIFLEKVHPGDRRAVTATCNQIIFGAIYCQISRFLPEKYCLCELDPACASVIDVYTYNNNSRRIRFIRATKSMLSRIPFDDGPEQKMIKISIELNFTDGYCISCATE